MSKRDHKPKLKGKHKRELAKLQEYYNALSENSEFLAHVNYKHRQRVTTHHSTT